MATKEAASDQAVAGGDVAKLAKYNPHHHPPGSADGGRFCSADETGGGNTVTPDTLPSLNPVGAYGEGIRPLQVAANDTGTAADAENIVRSQSNTDGNNSKSAIAGDALQAAVRGVNPSDSTQNCGYIIDAVTARLRGTDENAMAPDEIDGTWPEIEKRYGTHMEWGITLDQAYERVAEEGDGSMALIGIKYQNGKSHVVVMANDGGVVGIIEGQTWGKEDRQGVIIDLNKARRRYNGDARNVIGFGPLGKK